MLILTIRTDKPEAEIGLYDGDKQVAYKTWQAHRQLAETIHNQIEQLLDEHGYTLTNLRGIIFYKGPGSFTGLRIGASVANALTTALSLKIIGADGEKWTQKGIHALEDGLDDRQVVPEYGAEARTTVQKK